jgi:hypothetical protein
VNAGSFGVLHCTASVTLLAYLVLAVPQVVLQLLFAYRGALRQRLGGAGPTPPVDLIVPCFNEPLLVGGVVWAMTPSSAPKASQPAKPWKASTRLVIAVMVSRSPGSDRYGSSTIVRKTRPNSLNAR